MKKFTLSLLMGFLAMTGLNAQTHSHNGRVCGAMEHLQMQLAQDPTLKERMMKQEAETQAYIKSGNHTRVVVTIPVVVHVLYKTTAENISDAQVNSQLTVLNNDFRKLNADASLVPAAFAGLAADCEVNFCLAQRTPTGAATTGIVRKSTTVASWTTNDAIKYSAQGGDDAWDATKYLNLWVGTLGGGLLGYAQFPGTGLAATDGVVILNTAFGTTGTAAAPFNKGRTATHEVGHWLNLYHIWGDDSGACTGTDNVSDTPNQAGENYGVPTYPKTDACTATAPGVMFMNYMDYVDDAAMYMFTTGQKTRVQAALAGPRAALATSLGCQAPTGTTCAAPTGLNATALTTTGATVNWSAVSGATSYTLQYKTSAATTWTTLTGITTTSRALTGLTAATVYNYQVLAVCSATSSSAYTAATFTTASSTTTCNAPTGLASSAITSTGATVSWAAAAGATSYTLQYKTSAATTWTTVTGITTTSRTLTGLTAATTYNYQVLTVCSATSSSAYTASTFTTTAAACTDTYETNETAATAKTITANANISALIGTSTDIDWFKFTTTSAAPKVKVTLTTLPADYDVYLYASNGTTSLGSSLNAGTTSESIIYNTSTVAATYYVKVVGYSSAFNATSCYTLKAATGSTNFVRQSGEIVDGMKEDMVVFPNPANGIATVRLNPADTEAGMEIAIFDQMGRLVNAPVSTGAEKFEMNVDFTNVTTGVYFVRVTNGDNISTKKLVVSH
jgi:hypothetical protein